MFKQQCKQHQLTMHALPVAALMQAAQPTSQQASAHTHLMHGVSVTFYAYGNEAYPP